MMSILNEINDGIMKELNREMSICDFRIKVYQQNIDSYIYTTTNSIPKYYNLNANYLIEEYKKLLLCFQAKKTLNMRIKARKDIINEQKLSTRRMF